MVLSFLPLHKLRSTNHQLLQPLHYSAPQSPSLATFCSYNEIFLSVLLKHIHRHFPSTTNTLFQNTSSLPLNYWSYLRPSSHLFLLLNSPLGYNQRNHQITLPTFTSQFTVLAFQAVSVAYPYLGPTTRPATSRLPFALAFCIPTPLDFFSGEPDSTALPSFGRSVFCCSLGLKCSYKGPSPN